MDEAGTSSQTYEYFAIINNYENGNGINKVDEQNQVIYLAFGENAEEENETISEEIDNNEISETLFNEDQEKLLEEVNMDNLENNEGSNDDLQYDNLGAFGSNVKIITMNDGTMYLTTGEDEAFEAIEPHLLTKEENEAHSSLNVEDNEDINNEENSGLNYKIVQLVTDPTMRINFDQPNVNSSSADRSHNIIKKERKYKCAYKNCDKMYSTLYHLTVHLRSHMDVKPFECTMEGCDKKFSTNYSLKAHQRTHTGEKPYGCSTCDKHFKTSGDLQKHIRIHTGEKPFDCPVEGCGKSFTTSNIRKVHIRSHTGERPYTCQYPNCGKAFSSSTNYKNHIRIHSGEKPYVCSVEGCNKRFTEYSSLYKHNMVHQQNRPFTCAYCDQKFKQESAMNLHKRVQHNIILASDGTEIVVDFD